MFNRRNYYSLLALWGIIYIVGTIIAPLAPNRFNLTATSTHILQITIALPVVLIWAAAVFGAERFKSYSRMILNYPDGRAMNKIATGLIILVAGLLFSGFSGILRPWALKDGWLPQFTILFNFISAVLPLIAYCFMYSGSVDLLKLIKKPRNYMIGWLPVIIITLATTVIYLLALFNYDYRNNTPNPARFSSFYLPDGLILFTVALPYIIGWALGIKAAFNIGAYQRDIKGQIYKKYLSRVIVGFLLIIAFAMIVQLLVAFSTFFAKAGLGAILAIVYLLIVLYAAGFIVLASGTKRLNAIEKVK